MRKGAKVASTIGESGGYSRSFLEFRRIRSKAELDLIDSQLDLVEELGLMSPDDAINAVFGLLDKDNRGRFDTRELANGFREAGGDARVTRLLRKAADALPSDGDGTMNRTDFHDYIRFITPKFECATHEVIELLVVKVLFDNSSRGRGIFRHMPTTRADAAAGEKPNERMLALFDLFDKSLEDYNFKRHRFNVLVWSCFEIHHRPSSTLGFPVMFSFQTAMVHLSLFPL